jgi:signal transduction histidine kinase
VAVESRTPRALQALRSLRDVGTSLLERAESTLVEDVDACSTDPDRLAQLLANLLENAITFAHALVKVTVVEDPGAGLCAITVDDDGPGIAPGDLERVFERFYRAARGPNRQMGSGLGLAVVAELAAAMGGTVRAEPPVNAEGGSRFVVTLRQWQGAAPVPSLP